MRSVLVLLLAGGCGFTARLDASTSDAATPDACAAGAWWDARWRHRFAIDTAGAPAGYAARLDVTPALVLSAAAGDDLRVVVDDTTELDRALDGSALELRVPASGALWLYTANPEAGAPPASPGAIYDWSESFDTLALGGDGTPRFAPQTPADWTIVDDGGNRVYRVTGGGRHPAPIAGLTAEDVEVRARIRVGPGGTQNHNGLLVRASTVVPAMLDGYVGQLLEDSEYSRIAEYIDGVSPPTERGMHVRPVDRATWYALRLRAVGGTVELHVDGELEVTSAGTANGTALGLFAHATDVDYDDVRVRRLANPEPAFALGAREDAPCD